MSKLVTVFGATGAQGGSVARALSQTGLYKVRAVTRDTSKPAAKALEEQGIELVQADLSDRDAVLKAITGAYGVFGVTNFWDKADMDSEIAQGKNIANACRDASVQHLVWSSLPNVLKMTNGKLKHAKAFDGKAAVEEYIRELGIPATFFMPGTFMSNLKLGTRKNPEGEGFTLSWPLPAKTMVPLFDASGDTGLWVRTILAKPVETLGNSYQAATWSTSEEIVAIISKVAGIDVAFRTLPDQVFQSIFPDPAGKIRLESLINLRENSYFGPNAQTGTVESAKILDGKPTTLEEFVEKNRPWAQ